MPPVILANDHSLGTLRVETEMLLYGPVTTASGPGNKSGPYSGQGLASSPPTLSLLWRGALLHCLPELVIFVTLLQV